LKKIFVSILFVILIIVCQFFFSRNLSIFGAYPNIILISIVFFGMSKGRFEAVIEGFIFGLIWDSVATDIFGMRMLLFSIIGYTSGLLSRNFDNDQPYTQLLVVFVSLILYWIGTVIIYSTFAPESVNGFDAVLTLRNFGSALFTLIITIPTFFIMKLFDNTLSRRRR
jgi:rod shape-determining protein MreD